MQGSVSELNFISHGKPSGSGAGLLHSRIRVLFPPLQVTEQGENALHSLHPPFTGTQSKALRHSQCVNLVRDKRNFIKFKLLMYEEVLTTNISYIFHPNMIIITYFCFTPLPSISSGTNTGKIKTCVKTSARVGACSCRTKIWYVLAPFS